MSTVTQHNLFGLSEAALEAFAVEIGEKPFRGRQLFQWLYQKRVTDFAEMTNLNRPLRDRLAELAEIRLPKVVKEQTDPEDGTRKFLVELFDGEPVEMVLIPVGERLALCMSTQVGCLMACTFCATGKMGFKRNLTVPEMLGQVILGDQLAGEQGISTVVMMGMGEPLLNLDNVLETLRISASEKGIGISARRYTISTVGLVKELRKLIDSGMKASLALSLHAPIQELRQQLIPIAKHNPLDKLIPLCREYAEYVSDRVTLEYLLIDGVTDTMECAKALVKIANELPCKINLIPYNPIVDSQGNPLFRWKYGKQPKASSGLSSPRRRGPTLQSDPETGGEAPGHALLSFEDYRPSKPESIERFRDYLYPRCPAVTLRTPKGLKIAAACGQLAAKDS